MAPALSLAPITLAAVLVLSGVAKLGDSGATASMIRLLRVPSVLPRTVMARLLPWVELTTAALLLTPWRWSYDVGAAVAAVLFVIFLVVVARAMTFDPRPACGCFGRVGNHRINGRTLTRNVILVVLAALALWIAVGGSSAGALVASYRRDDWLWLLLSVALSAVAVLVLGGEAPRSRTSAPTSTAGSQSDASAQEHELDYIRIPFPPGVLVDSDLQATTLHAMARGQAQVLVLVNCWCGPTYEVIQRLPRWRDQVPALGVPLVHTHSPWDEPRVAELPGVWWDPGAQVYSALHAASSPAAVLLGTDGLLAGGPVNGVEEIEAFVLEIADQLRSTSSESEALGDHAG